MRSGVPSLPLPTATGQDNIFPENLAGENLTLPDFRPLVFQVVGVSEGAVIVIVSLNFESLKVRTV